MPIVPSFPACAVGVLPVLVICLRMANAPSFCSAPLAAIATRPAQETRRVVPDSPNPPEARGRCVVRVEWIVFSIRKEIAMRLVRYVACISLVVFATSSVHAQWGSYGVPKRCVCPPRNRCPWASRWPLPTSAADDRPERQRPGRQRPGRQCPGVCLAAGHVWRLAVRSARAAPLAATGDAIVAAHERCDAGPRVRSCRLYRSQRFCRPATGLLRQSDRAGPRGSGIGGRPRLPRRCRRRRALVRLDHGPGNDPQPGQ